MRLPTFANDGNATSMARSSARSPDDALTSLPSRASRAIRSKLSFTPTPFPPAANAPTSATDAATINASKRFQGSRQYCTRPSPHNFSAISSANAAAKVKLKHKSARCHASLWS